MFTVDRIPLIDGIQPAIGPHTDVGGRRVRRRGLAPRTGRRAGPRIPLRRLPDARPDRLGTAALTGGQGPDRAAAVVAVVRWERRTRSRPKRSSLPGKIPYAVTQASQESYQFSEGAEVVPRACARAYRATTPGSSPNMSWGPTRPNSARATASEASSTATSPSASAGSSPTRFGRGPTARRAADAAESRGIRTHVVSIVAGYDFGRGWRVGARVFFESGRPLPPVCLFGCSSPSGPAATYHPSGDLPQFWRVDARLEKRWTFPAGQWLAATLECFNLLGMREPVNDSHPPHSPSPTDVKVSNTRARSSCRRSGSKAACERFGSQPRRRSRAMAQAERTLRWL